MTWAVTLPIRVNTTSNTCGNWFSKAKRAKEQRGLAELYCRGVREVIALPAVVTLTRIGPRALDDDNLASALKHVRDGVADALGTHDGPGSGLTWRYGQAKGEYAVRIEIKKDNDDVLEEEAQG